MTRNALSYGNKLTWLFLLFVLTTTSVSAQRPGPRKTASTKSFLDTQWWLGIRTGITFANPEIEERFYGFSPIDYFVEDNDKTYTGFSEPGMLMGLDIIFYHKGFSIGFHPAYKSLKYGYTQSQTWTSGGSDALQTTIDARQLVAYLEVPFLVKYDLIKSGKIRPFVQTGWQYSYLLSANKEASIVQQDFITDPPQRFNGGEINVRNKDAFASYTGVVGGVGVNLDYLNIRTVVEINYQHSLSPGTSQADPFSENELVALGDAQDRLNLNQLSFSVSFVFPLRFIDNTFSPY